MAVRYILRFAVIISVIVPLLSAVMHAAEAAKPVPTRNTELERDARKALVEAAALRGLPDTAAVERLTGLYRQVSTDVTLPSSTRLSLRQALKARLERWSAALTQARERPSPNLAQQLAPPAGNQLPTQPGPGTLGPDLVKLIEETIHSSSWEPVGGQGVIRFWGPGNALVVQQTTEAHEDLEQLLGDLR